MATKTPGASALFPGGQKRQQFGFYWGQYAAAADLPNASGNVLDAANFRLEVGDVAFVTGDGSQYRCIDPGTAGGSNALWLPGANQDHFAPKYVIGNEPAGDSASAYSSEGFVYIPDPGDGSGIAAAFAMVVGFPEGDVWIRPGTYNLTTRLSIPQNVVVRGGTQLGVQINSPPDDACCFVMEASTQLHFCQLVDGTDGSVGLGVIETALYSTTVDALSPRVISNVLIQASSTLPGVAITEGGLYRLSSVQFFHGGSANNAIVVNGGGVGGIEASLSMYDCDFSGAWAATPIVIGDVGSVIDSRIYGNRIALDAGIVPVAFGANAANCILGMNVSRGSGSVLPTDAGVGNSIVNNIWGA